MKNPDDDEYSGFHTLGTDIDEAYGDTFQNDDDVDEVESENYDDDR